MAAVSRLWEEAVRGMNGSGVVFLLDFDGTLAPIVGTPHHAELPDETRSLLRRLSHLKSVHVIVVSGRPLNWVEHAVAVKGLTYAGNHGLEIRGPGLRFHHSQARKLRPVLHGIAREARLLLKTVPGAVIEDKDASLSLHYRGVPKSRLKAFKTGLEALRRLSVNLPVRWRRGKKVWEVLPDVRWDKGAAARLLLARFHEPYPVAVGDDRTDEDLFAAVAGRGLTIRVGRGRTLARARLRRQEDVRRLLDAAYCDLAAR